MESTLLLHLFTNNRRNGNCGTDNTINIIFQAIEQRDNVSLELCLSTILLLSRAYQSEFQYKQISDILNRLKGNQSVDKIIKDTIENLLSASDLIRITAAPHIAQNYQQIIVKTSKVLLIDPSCNRLSHSKTLNQSLEVSAFNLDNNNYEILRLKDEKMRILVREQITQLSAIFKSRLDNIEKSYQKFRLQFISDIPIILNNSNSSWSKIFTYDKQSINNYAIELSPLIQFIESTMVSRKMNENNRNQCSAVISISSKDFLDITFSYCIKVSTNYPNLDNAILEKYRLSGMFLSYFIHKSSEQDKLSIITDITSILSSNLLNKIHDLNNHVMNDDIIAEIIYVISLTCFMYFEVSIESTDKEEMHIWRECYELLSWAISIVCCMSDKVDVHYDRNNCDNNGDMNDDNRHVYDGDSTSNNINDNHSNNKYSKSIIRSAIHEFYTSKYDLYIAKDHFSMKNKSLICMEYLKLHFTSPERPLIVLLNSKEAFHCQITEVFPALSAAHRYQHYVWVHV
jgi:hypothetical protein